MQINRYCGLALVKAGKNCATRGVNGMDNGAQSLALSTIAAPYIDPDLCDSS